jgi:hypothetical protein
MRRHFLPGIVSETSRQDTSLSLILSERDICLSRLGSMRGSLRKFSFRGCSRPHRIWPRLDLAAPAGLKAREQSDAELRRVRLPDFSKDIFSPGVQVSHRELNWIKTITIASIDSRQQGVSFWRSQYERASGLSQQ